MESRTIALISRMNVVACCHTTLLLQFCDADWRCLLLHRPCGVGRIDAPSGTDGSPSGASTCFYFWLLCVNCVSVSQSLHLSPTWQPAHKACSAVLRRCNGRIRCISGVKRHPGRHSLQPGGDLCTSSIGVRNPRAHDILQQR